jgi:uncharacterized repeat protein (TIGR01451 family)
MRIGLARALVVASALGGGCTHVTHYTLVHNGGVPSVRGQCSELAVADVGGELRVIPATSAGCETVEAFLIPEGTTFALWQIGGSALAGPANANDVAVKVPALDSGEGARKLTSGESEKRLTSGEGQKGLASGQSERRLTSGEGQRALSSGQGQRALASGEGQRALSAGEGQKTLSSGQGDKRLESGEGARQLGAGQAEKPVLVVAKAADRDYTTVDKPVTFSITAHNVGATPLARVVVVDRLSSKLVLADGGGAGVQPLPDGSTLMIWVLAEPLGPDARTRTLTFRATPRAAPMESQ